MNPRSRRTRLLRCLPDRYVLTGGDRRQRTLYLTLDDGPDPERTPRMLDLLQRHDARATFFMVGDRIERHPQVVERVIAQGHAIGNHSWNHPRFDRITLAEQLDQIHRTDAVLRAFDGRSDHDVRPPNGVFSPALLLRLARGGRRIAHWSYNTLDYMDLPLERLLQLHRTHAVRSGDILLAHDDTARTLPLLDASLRMWREQGFRFDVLAPRAAAGVA